jgi:protein-tyrosine phosphatase
MTYRTSADSKLLLFVCTGNFYRSRHAEALFNWHAERQGLAARAFSRGLLTSLVADEPTLLSRDTERRLGQLGIPLHHTGSAPTQLRKEDLARAHRTIALKRDEHHAMMLQAHPEWADRIEYWAVHDIDFLTPAEALPQIEARVLELVREFGGSA